MTDLQQDPADDAERDRLIAEILAAAPLAAPDIYVLKRLSLQEVAGVHRLLCWESYR